MAATLRKHGGMLLGRLVCIIPFLDDTGPMAKRAFGASALSSEEADATALAGWIRRKGLSEFNARGVRRSPDGPGGRLVAPSAMATACGHLEEAGLIRRTGGRTGEHKGRTRHDYTVNPIMLEARL